MRFNMIMNTPHAFFRKAVFVCLLFACRVSSGAILNLEDFTAVDGSGWVARDSFMSVTDPINVLQGDFADQGIFFVPETDAFRIATGTDFLGDYTTGLPLVDYPLTQISFYLLAVNVLPTDLFIRISDGVNTFSYQFNPINFSDTYVVNLAWSYGWNGLDENAFNAALASIDWIDIQISRNGSGAQTYLLDNVQTLNTDIGGPGGGGDTAVPEPATLSLFLLALTFLSVYRKMLVGKRAVN